MPAKELEISGLGKVRFYKRRDSRSIKITLSHQDYVRVTMPYWLPYRAGIEYAKSKSDWVSQNRRRSTSFVEGAHIGKAHRLTFLPSASAKTASSRVSATEVRITHPDNFSSQHHLVQTAAKNASLRALTMEAQNLLPQRLEYLAQKHSFKYKDIRVRKLRSRWGSCSQNANISLNIHLMQLPWELIDYVILHELTHTKYLNHSPKFWNHLESCMPGAKQVKKQLRALQPVI